MKPHTTLKHKGLWQERLFVFPKLDSTNTWALEHSEDLRNGDVIHAHQQTAGHGRFGRPWISQENACLTFSCVFCASSLTPSSFTSLTQTAAIAVQRFLKAQGIPSMLKWPNDVLVQGKKIAGILAETTPDAAMAILGIGLNVNLSKALMERAGIGSTATSMAAETGREWFPEKLLPPLLKEIEDVLKAMSSDNGHSLLPRCWTPVDFLAGRKITLTQGKETISGLYEGIDGAGRLLLRRGGDIHHIWSGDVTLANHSSA